MTDRKQHHPLEGGSRISAYTFDPSELMLVTDTRDPLYDRRIEDPLDRAFVLNIAARGVRTAISVRRRGADSVVVRGKQRTKAVTVINHLACGVKYAGAVKAIMTAIRDFGADEDFVKKLTLWVKKPLKIRALPENAGDDRDVRLDMRAENVHRHGDPLLERVRVVQEEQAKYGTPIEEIAIAEGISEATVKRWLKMDTNTPRMKKKRGKATRPSLKQIQNFTENTTIHLTGRERMILDWVLGRSNGVDMAERFLGTSSKKDEARA